MTEPAAERESGSALVVVDVQNDFCEGGALQVSGGVDVAHSVARYLREHGETYDLRVASRDWHVDPRDHFSAEPDFVDSWPPHCVAETLGADFHPVVEEALSESPYLTVSKGMYSAAYSAFEAEDPDGQLLPEVLQVHGIEHVDIVGLCTDYCVAQTALDAARAGLHTRVLVDFTAGVHPGSTQQAIGRMKRAGIEVV